MNGTEPTQSPAKDPDPQRENERKANFPREKAAESIQPNLSPESTRVVQAIPANTPTSTGQTARLAEATLVNPATAIPTGSLVSGTSPSSTASAAPHQAPTANSPFGPGHEPETSPGGLPKTLQARYHLKRVLGKGGFANVYLAHDEVLDQDVAIKILKLGLASKADTDRFLFEARVGAKLRHHNISQVFDIIQTPEGLQMIMEYYPHGTLTERVKKKGALRPREAIEIARQVAAALAYAHKRSFVHRDVKPANIFFGGEGVVKLGDFGIAAQADLHEHTQTGMVIGTPLYMAPEQAHDSRNVDPRADIYALGLTLYFMLTGKAPRVVDLDLVPTQFRKLIKTSTEQDRGQRLVSCEQFIAMLDQIQTELTMGGGAGAKGEVHLADTVIEPSRTPTAPGSEAPATNPLTPPITNPPTGEPISGERTPGGTITPATLGSVSTLTEMQLQTQTSSTLGSGTTTQTSAPQGIGKGLYAIVAAGFLMIAIPLFYLAFKITKNPTSESGGHTVALHRPSAVYPAISSVAPSSGEAIANSTPAATSKLFETPKPLDSNSPSPTQSAPQHMSIPVSKPSPAISLAQPPPAGSPGGARTIQQGVNSTPSPRPSPPPAVLRPGPPPTFHEALIQRANERERIQSVWRLLEFARNDPLMAQINLQTAMDNIQKELIEQPNDVVTHVLAGMIMHRLGKAGWQREIGEAHRLNINSQRPIRLGPPVIRQLLNLTPKEEGQLRPFMPRPPLDNFRGGSPPQSGEGPPQRPGESPPPPPPMNQ